MKTHFNTYKLLWSIFILFLNDIKININQHEIKLKEKRKEKREEIFKKSNCRGMWKFVTNFNKIILF